MAQNIQLTQNTQLTELLPAFIADVKHAINARHATAFSSQDKKLLDMENMNTLLKIS